MVADGYGKKRMSRETGLSYNTVVKYLERLETPVVATSPAADEAGGT